ncbi:hypothetical protein [Actinoplanes sp. NBRC 101535]|uniref:hypothetical protein n=1 Tax=Actinoplanes sp. NBRC 101535 TaxID=3032196 RepID=UPI0024A1B322|nr:hypothetical protein [Actinoplanes sp. NBRC 101535]GLY08684.1 hypothetical protein Acsp01_90630 [Actinoplanes sp. NBRC 101535]
MSAGNRRREPHIRSSVERVQRTEGKRAQRTKGKRVQRTEPAADRTVNWLWVWIVCVLLATVVGIGLGASPASMVVGDGLAAGLCWMTGCADGGLALIGWALTLVPLVLVLVTWFLFPHSGTRGRVVLLALGTMTLTFVVLMTPDPRDRMSGDGAAFLADGMLWGVGTIIVGAVLLAVGLGINRLFSGSGFIPFVCVSTTLVLGGVFTYADNHNDDAEALVTAAQLFPDATLTSAGSTLTRVSASDWQGCSGQYPKCGHTAEFAFTTTDSDAVTHVEIIWFSSATDAWDAEKTVLPSDDPTALRVSTVNHEHVMVATVKHADGRTIHSSEERWLRWPAAQINHVLRKKVGSNPRRVGPLRTSETAAPLHL